MQHRSVGLSLFGVTLALAACVPAVKEKGLPRLAASCDEAAGEATMSDIRVARHFARNNLTQHLASSRDYLASLGVKRTRIQKPVLRCAPYPLSVGPSPIWRCVATARLCAR